MTNDRFKLTEEIISTADKGMNKLIAKNIKLNFNELESFEFPLDEPFGLQVFYKNTIFCFVIRFSSKNKNLICAGTGAHERDTIKNNELIKPPFFNRWSWYKYFNESFISYADPMLFYDDTIKVAWFVGTKDDWYLENLAEIIKELTKNQGIINDNILFYGSSGGGYTSVVLGTLINNSQVLINNSQLFILNYWEKMVDQLFDMLYDTFEGMTRDEIINEILYRLDVIELFKKEKYAPFITYYVNVESEADIERHALPFFKRIYQLDEFNGLDIRYYREFKEVPHEPMSVKITIETIKTYCRNHLYNSHENKDWNNIGKDIFIEEKYIKELQRKNRKLKKQNNAMKKTISWRITAPLRKIKRVFNNLNSLLKH